MSKKKKRVFSVPEKTNVIVVPPERAITQADLKLLRKKLDRTSVEAAFLLGLSDSQLRIHDSAGREPLRTASLKILFRLYDRHTKELNVIPKPPPITQIAELIERHWPYGDDPKFTKRYVALILGRAANSYYNWEKNATKTAPQVQKICLALKTLSATLGEEETIKSYFELLDIEATHAGFLDFRSVLLNRSWDPPVVKEPDEEE